MVFSHPTLIFTKRYVESPVQTVFYSPMSAGCFGKTLDIRLNFLKQRVLRDFKNPTVPDSRISNKF
jgi:hypothetical protein